MLTQALNRIMSIPWVYDQVQLLAGARYVHRQLAPQIASFVSGSSVVLDLGGGTGIVRRLLSPVCVYICLDLDMVKLRAFQSKYPDGIAVLSDVTQVPARTGSIDVVICTCVSHHLSDELLEQLIAEGARVLKSIGAFVFLDPVWEPRSLVGRLLWKYDRGSYPRTKEHLGRVISDHFRAIYTAQFSVLHEYLLCVGVKRSSTRSDL